jgi:hypothetical protein
MKYNRVIDQFITYTIEPHREVEGYSNNIFWYMGNEVIAEIENSEYFYLNRKIRNRIATMFDLNDTETKSAIILWLEEHYDLGGLTVQYFTIM